MVLKAVLESVDDLDSSVQEHYRHDEKSGKYILDIGDVQALPDVVRLDTSLRKEREAHKETKAKFSPFKDLGDAQEIIAKLDRIPELEAAADGKLDDNKISTIVETRLKAKLSPVERERDQLRARAAELEGTIQQYTAKERTSKISNAISKAAREVKVIDSALDDVDMYGDRVFEVDDAGNVVTKDGVGVTPGITAKEWLIDMQAKRPHWWGTTQGGGSQGSRGGGGLGVNNPWSHDGWNMTAQGTIVREKGMPHAEQLAKLAGTTVGGGKPAKK